MRMKGLSRLPDEDNRRYKLLSNQILSLLLERDELTELDFIVDKTLCIDRREAKVVLRKLLLRKKYVTTGPRFRYRISAQKEDKIKEKLSRETKNLSIMNALLLDKNISMKYECGCGLVSYEIFEDIQDATDTLNRTYKFSSEPKDIFIQKEEEEVSNITCPGCSTTKEVELVFSSDESSAALDILPVSFSTKKSSSEQQD